MSVLNQKTINKNLKFKGVGLHSGLVANMTIKPAEPNSGIIFKRIDLKENNYNVICPNNILVCMHHHKIKIFANAHSKWIDRNGNFKPLEYYSNIHKKQKNKPWNEKIVGGGIPFFMGACKIVGYL